jgi:predicted secreted hydrolase
MKRYLLLTCLIVMAGIAVFLFFNPDSSLPEPEASGHGSRLSELLGRDDGEAYSMAAAARTFRFPQDHGPHPDFRNEWWYLTGNLDGQRGQRFGFELTFFRFALSSETDSDSGERSASGWRTNQVYIAHFAVTDKESDQFHVEQRFSRGALNLAGAQSAPFRVWIEDWSITENPHPDSATVAQEHWQLSAPGDGISLYLDLKAEKPPVLNGVDGLSQKSSAEGNASYYYSLTRLASAGPLRIAGETYQVSGLSWLDREWSSSSLAADQQGWDWFALQLSDGSDLMFYNIRKSDGSQDEHSAGTWISKNGRVRHLSRKDLAIIVTDKWTSPEGGTYPAHWDIHVPGLDLMLTIAPLIENQELFTTVRYWEGAVDVTGRQNGIPIEGRGYVELTGYAR